MTTPQLPIRTFDRDAEYFVVERRDLPHWVQAGTIAFITWRTWDSIPKPVLAAWRRVQGQWLRAHGIDPADAHLHSRLAALDASAQSEFRNLVSERWEQNLDECHGQCVLRQSAISQIVADSLHHFDSQRYVLLDYVVMPNHVHLLAAFLHPEGMLEQCRSWKHYTAVQINRHLNRTGRFWEVDDFDHLVRSEDQLAHYQAYIADNPRLAHLRDGEFRHYSRTVESTTVQLRPVL